MVMVGPPPVDSADNKFKIVFVMYNLVLWVRDLPIEVSYIILALFKLKSFSPQPPSSFADLRTGSAMVRCVARGGIHSLHPHRLAGGVLLHVEPGLLNCPLQFDLLFLCAQGSLHCSAEYGNVMEHKKQNNLQPILIIVISISVSSDSIEFRFWLDN